MPHMPLVVILLSLCCGETTTGKGKAKAKGARNDAKILEVKRHFWILTCLRMIYPLHLFKVTQNVRTLALQPDHILMQYRNNHVDQIYDKNLINLVT